MFGVCWLSSGCEKKNKLGRLTSMYPTLVKGVCVCVISTMTHSHAVERDRFFLYTLKVLVTDAEVVVRATARLALSNCTCHAAAACIQNLPSSAAEVWRAFPHVARDAGQRLAVLHQQECHQLTKQQTLQIHHGAKKNQLHTIKMSSSVFVRKRVVAPGHSALKTLNL